MQPGQTITPGGPQPPEQTTEPQTVVPPPQIPPIPEMLPPEQTTEPQLGSTPQDTNAAHPDHFQTIQWNASEYVQHDKPTGWFFAVVGVGVLSAILLYLVTNDWITSLIVVIVAVIFGYAGGRRPRTLNYELNTRGIAIGTRFFPYETFKSFSLIEEGAIDSILLLPLKRFMPPLSLYYPPDQEEQILMTLSDYLPHEEQQHDPLDKFMRRIRF